MKFRHIASVNEADFVESLQKDGQVRRESFARSTVEEADRWRPNLLRARRQRPCGRAAEQRDEFAPPDHSITSSAVASSVGGNSRPSALAVFMLITSSNLTGACTGSSLGLVPFRIRSA